MSPRWRFVLYLGGYLMLIPTTLVGLALAVTVYHAHSFRFHEGVLLCVAGELEDGTTRIWGKPGAQTLGWLTIGASEEELARADLRAHEFTHVADALAAALIGLVLYPVAHVLLGGELVTSAIPAPFAGGLAFDLLYGLFFLVPFALQGFTDWHTAYHKNPFEKHAYAVGDAELAREMEGAKPYGWGSKPQRNRLPSNVV